MRLRDEYGTVLYSGGSLANNTLYRDTFSLPDGCYVFELDDTDDDGIDFWANSDGIGYARFREIGGSIFKFFEPDFGKFVIDHFTVGDALGEGPDKNSCTPFSINEAGIDDLGILVYPNPTTGILLTEIDLPSRQDVEIGIYSMLGVQVYKKHIGDVLFVKEEIDLGNIAPGLYLLNIKSDLHSVSKMIILAY